jgi:hypothetical protein
MLQQQQQQQQHHLHPLATTMPPPSSSTAFHHHPTSLVRPHPDAVTGPIDFTSTDALFLSPLGPTSPLEDFEDLDYQSGFANYQKQHMVPRHTSLVSQKESKSCTKKYTDE